MSKQSLKLIFCVAIASAFGVGTAYAKGGSHGSSHGSHAPKASPGGSHSVHGYTKRSGTYVAPHRKTNPDSTKRNNYDSKGNVNPSTGKAGTKDPSRP